MFGSKKKQYVVITTQDKQLKLNYKTMQDEKILKEEHSSFLITNQTMPGDALFKLEALQKEIPLTYFGTLFEGENQKLVKNEELDVISYESIKMNDSMHIVIPKNELVSRSRYFLNSGIDYIFSPFSILNEYIQDFGVKNSLNVFILNNTVYTMLLGEYKEVVRADTKELTPFDEIKDEEFSGDEIVDQKLYEEVHFLEMQQFLNDIVQEYYSSGDDVDFLEEVKVIYTLQPFTNDQLDSLYETLMVSVNYEQIDLQYYLSKIITSEEVLNYSFIDPRVKKEKNTTMSWLFLVILSLIALVAVVYFNMSEPSSEPEIKEEMAPKTNIEKPVEVKKELQVIEEKATLPQLPDHTVNNYNVRQNILMHFDIVPYDAVLKDIEVYETTSTFVVNFAMPSKSLEDMQMKLKNIYEDSKVLLQHQNKAILNAIVENNSATTEIKEVTLKSYPKLNIMPIARATDYIKAIVAENSVVKLDTKLKDAYQTYNFTITSKIEDPIEFFRLLDKLNKQQSSISVDYPIKFSRLNDAIEVKYGLKLHQENEKEVQPKN